MHYRFIRSPKVAETSRMYTITKDLARQVKMFTYKNHKMEQSQTSSNRKRKLFAVDNLKENISPSKVYDLEHAFPETSFNINPVELSPTLSEKFESLISNSKNEHLCLSSIAPVEFSSSQPIEHNTITPLKSENVEGIEHILKENFGSNEIKKISHKDFGDQRVTRSHYNPKVKAKPFKDSKSTSKKRPRSTSRELKTKINLFPDGISPLKKKSMDMKSCKKEEKTNSTKKNVVKKIKTPKQSSSKKKNVWTEYMNQDKPKRILLEQDSNRKFFKSKVIHNDTPNQKKNNGFNFKVINWNDKNRNGSRVEVKKSNLNSPKILNDNKIDENGQHINKSIELLNDNHMTAIHSPLQTPTFKRNHEDPKCMNKDVQNQSSIVEPVLIKNAYGFYENYNEEKCLSVSPAASLKKVSNSSIDCNDTIIDEPANTSIDFNDKIINELDTSVIVNESSQTNLFPIFINETPPLNHIICSSEKKSSVQKRKRIIDNTQCQIYAGQNKFGGFLCKECGLYYSRGEPEDEAEHDKYHKAKEIFKYKSSKNEKVIFKDIDERIVVISGSDTKILCSKALEVMLYVDKELGCDTQHSVLPTTKKVHLYIKKRQVIGCLVIDLISQAYRNLETETEDMVVLSEESYPVKAGVSSVWTKWDYRNTGIATKLLDYFRKNYAFGHILALNEIAFTVPTRSGKQFIKKYTNQNDFLVYTGW